MSLTKPLAAVGPYALAAVSTALALLIGRLTPLAEQSPSALFFAAVMVASWCGGLGPGLLATALSVLAIDYFLVPPRDSLVLDLGDVARMGVFVLEAVVISGLNAVRRRLEQSLREQNQELLAADRYKDTFLAMVSHELRSPLSVLTTSLHLLRSKTAGTLGIDYPLDAMGRQLDRMTRLVEDMVDFARIRRNELRLEKESIELGALLRRSVETAQPAVDQRRHQLSLMLPAGEVWLQADPYRLEQVLVNIITNAAKYTEPGGQIELSAIREGDTAIIAVRDNGIGIAPESLPRVFDPFLQVHKASGSSRGGLGLGLSLVARLVELHGGRVEAHSEGLGKGSRFVVRLPLDSRATMAGDRSASLVTACGSSAAPLDH